MLANAAIKEPPIILIDEPELNLHPSLQIDFLSTLGGYAKEGTVLFCTHNLGLARATAEHIYAVHKVGDFESAVTPYEAVKHLAEFASELSFSAFKELGVDKILLVEGPTDVRAVQQLLRLYNKEHSVVLLPLGGDSLINAGCEPQLVELKRLSENIVALIDSERTAAGEPLSVNRQGFVEACAKAGVKCHVLERRVLENYFTERAIQAAKGREYTSLTPHQTLKQSPKPWSKEEHWRLARETTRNEIDQTDLGIF